MHTMAEKSLNQTEEDSLDQARWVMVFNLLSMDVVVPFYDLMGFRPTEPEAFKDVVRGLVLEARRELAVDVSKGATVTAEWFLCRIGAALGAPVRRHVLWWGHHIFAYALKDHRELEAWTNLLRYCGTDPALWNGLRLEVRDEILSKFRESLKTPAYDLRAQTVYDRPLSDWDLHLYATFAFDDEDPGIPNGPKTYVKPTVKAYHGYRFWAWILRHFRSEMDTLYQNALPIARLPDNQPLMDDLPPPHHLDVGL